MAKHSLSKGQRTAFLFLTTTGTITMPNQNDGSTPFFEIVVYVSASLTQKVAASLDLFVNTPDELIQHTVYKNGHRLTIVTIKSSFMNNTSYCVDNIPNIASELALIICDCSATEITTANVIRRHRIKKKLGITFVDVIDLESQGINTNYKYNNSPGIPLEFEGLNHDVTEFNRHSSEGIKYWQSNSYDSLINSIKISLYILGFYFPTPIVCIDWSDFFSILKSRGCSAIFLQGDDIVQLTEDCCRYAAECGGSSVAIMCGVATVDDFNMNIVSKVSDITETHTKASDYTCLSVCYGPAAGDFLPFINPKLAWCWLGFRSDLTQEITPIDINYKDI